MNPEFLRLVVFLAVLLAGLVTLTGGVAAAYLLMSYRNKVDSMPIWWTSRYNAEDW